MIWVSKIQFLYIPKKFWSVTEQRINADGYTVLKYPIRVDDLLLFHFYCYLCTQCGMYLYSSWLVIVANLFMIFQVLIRQPNNHNDRLRITHLRLSSNLVHPGEDHNWRRSVRSFTTERGKRVKPFAMFRELWFSGIKLYVQYCIGAGLEFSCKVYLLCQWCFAYKKCWFQVDN